MEQKAARREAARERETSPAMTRLPGGGDVMGGDDSFQAARARSALQVWLSQLLSHADAGFCQIACSVPQGCGAQLLLTASDKTQDGSCLTSSASHLTVAYDSHANADI